MAGITSTLDNTPVYMMGKNAFPRNYIGDGMKMIPQGRSVNITEGYCDINGKYYENQVVNQEIPEMIAGLVYAKETAYSECPQFGFAPASFPEADEYTIGRWIIDGSPTIPNSAVGKNSIAVENNLTRMGTVNQVPGWIGYAGQGDGSTGYYVSENSTGFPSGASEKEVNTLFTVNAINASTPMGINMLWGGAGATNQFYAYISTSGVLMISTKGNDTSTSYAMEVGKTYLLTCCYDGLRFIVFVNGNLVFSTAMTASSVITDMYVGSLGVGYYGAYTFHYTDIRNKMHTPAQIAQIANKLCLPCFYDSYQSEYPEISTADKATAWHEWKFDETSGTTVADSAGTLNGTATGTIIVDSEIGLGKARKFASGNKVDLGAYIFPSEFTIITVAKFDLNSGRIMGNYNGSVGNAFGTLNTQGNKLTAWSNTSAHIASDGAIPLGKSAFYAWKVSNNNNITFYIDSPNPDSTKPFIVNTTTSSNLQLGNVGNGIEPINGSIDYILFIPRALSQAEIAVIYKKLMKQQRRNIIHDLLPANSISLGFVKTDSSAVTDFDDSLYMFGRREKAYGGNRKVFLGWKPFSGQQEVKWDNPFGTRKVKTTYVIASDANGTNEVSATPRFDAGSNSYGYDEMATPSNRIRIRTLAYGLGVLNNVWVTSGYAGCYASVLEDD